MPEPPKELDGLANKVIGAALEIHRHLGPGFLECVYEEALTIELDLRGVVFERQRPVTVFYKNCPAGQYRVDLLVGGNLVVELKAAEKILPIHKAQLISYLKASGLPLGLLINFNEKLLKDGIRRIVLT